MEGQISLIEGNINTHKELILSFRKYLSNKENNQENNQENNNNNNNYINNKISLIFNDHDILRFLRARNGDFERTERMINDWYEWRFTLLDPIPPYNIRMTPNIILSTPSTLLTHSNRNLLPLTHHGFSKFGHPIYWEKTGYIQSTFPEVKRKFTNTELLQFHLQSNEIFENRLKFISNKLSKKNHENVENSNSNEETKSNHNNNNSNENNNIDNLNGPLVSKYIIVFDMNYLQISLDFDSIWYIKQILEIDQKYYPERLFKMFIINCPWYFNTIYAIFKPFIDQKTRDKIIILGSDFLSSLEEVIDLNVIPVEYGGQNDKMKWEMVADEEQGTSNEQIEEFLQERLQLLKDHITIPEAISLHQAYYIKKTEYRIKWLLEYLLNQQITILSSLPTNDPQIQQTQINISFLKEEVARIHPSNIALQEGYRSSITANIPEDAPLLPSKPIIRVCDILKTEIVGVERKSDHHNYVINVTCRKNPSWQIKRRYSQFSKFHKILCRLIPSHSKNTQFPPKKFFKMSSEVASERRILLGQYLQNILYSCTSFDTPEQDLIFKFLGCYEHIINDITELHNTQSSFQNQQQVQQSWAHLDQQDQQMNTLRLRSNDNNDHNNNQNNGNNNNNGENNNENNGNNINNNEKQLQLKDLQFQWTNAGAPFAAVFLSACMIVLSFMGQVMSR